jgi:hypothetical protein
MKEVCTVLAILSIITTTVLYCYKIWTRKIQPTLSTWITFQTGVVLSLVTFLLASDWNFKSNFLNTIDVLATSAIVITMIPRGTRKTHFRPFEKWYLVGAAFIVAYGFITGDAWHSNLFAQGLITLGYIPTIITMVTEKRNTESFATWGMTEFTCLIALYPVWTSGDVLAIVYLFRGIFMISLLLVLMAYYELRSRRNPVHQTTV